MGLNYVKHETVDMKKHPELTEAWVRDRIVDDPSILGLGELDVKDVERLQPKAGRLDLLLHDPENDKRYEVEIMLGRADETHIIRCIEYWDIERKRYPQYDHVAVLVAEDITSRFLNVISLFNSAIPIIAMQMKAIRIGDNVALDFTQVLGEIVRGEDDEEEAGSGGEVTDRAYWEKKASPQSLALADAFEQLAKQLDADLRLNYRKHYIGLADIYRARNFVVFRAKKAFIRADIYISDKKEWAAKLEEAAVVVISSREDRKRLSIQIQSAEEMERNRGLLTELLTASYEQHQGEVGDKVRLLEEKG